MRLSEAFTRLEPAKSRLCLALVTALGSVPGIRSVTFTGSFVEKPGLEGISDIDVVVIAEELTALLFADCQAAAINADPALLGLPGHTVRLNATFGPLKFDEPGVIVIHLMVYDLAGHREHVLQSPFTCLDWERSPYHAGPSLRRIYPVTGLCPRHFFAARRSLGNYLQDVAAGTLSYRRHDFSGPRRQEVVAHLPLDRRHQGEYAYHIVRNLVANYAKLIMGGNRKLGTPELLDFWRTRLPGCHGLAGWFGTLAEIKQARGQDFPADTLDRTREFLDHFSRDLHEAWTGRAVQHLFVRHARTALNDGSFLGQGRDPAIAGMPGPLELPPRLAFSSPARRARETIAALAPRAAVTTDERLCEINYGHAEGLTFPQLAQQYPDLPAGWDRGQDLAFPDGENTSAVAARLEAFLAGLPAEPSLVVTHNVVLRCLVGSRLGLPLACWHRIPVAHLESFEVLSLDGTCYLNLTPTQSAHLGDALTGHLA